ncbi:cytochrome P450 family protein [Ceratobasidium sp. AG-Ba]|nr:cytochrome P450 family protein [Ceratobasidium sp. AG-Ba]
MIVTGSQEIATDLFDTRSSIYSDRTCPPAVKESSLMNWGNTPVVTGYNDTWRNYRRVMHNRLNKHAISVFRQSQQSQARLLLQRLLNKSHDSYDSRELNRELYQAISTTLLESIYGYSPQNLDDPFVVGMKEAVSNFSMATISTNFLVNIFPTLKYVPSWFPGADWKRTLRQWGKQKDKIVEGLLDWTKSHMALDNDNVSMVASLLEDINVWGLDEPEANSIISEVGASLFGKSILVFVLAMVLFPDVQVKAQEEIDRIVGVGQLPAMDDQPHLPYLGPVVQEVLRWQPVLPLGIPHVCTKENEYNGYLIPRDAIVLGNIWYIINGDVAKRENIQIQRLSIQTVSSTRMCHICSHSAGDDGNACPGMHYAQASLSITIASILATFNSSSEFTALHDVIVRRPTMNL